MASPQVFKVRVEFEDNGEGPAHEPMTLAVTRNADIRTAQDAVAHCMAVVGEHNGRPVTRIHHRDLTMDEYYSLVKCEPVRDEPFSVEQAPRLSGLTAKPTKE